MEYKYTSVLYADTSDIECYSTETDAVSLYCLLNCNIGTVQINSNG